MPNSPEPQHVGPSSQEPPVTGAHTLGPHVVNTRVVVRRLLPGETGPTGGPAFTDVLGICRSWGSEHCEVERADGTVVTIRTADIVSGKPVPPRPSVRHRVGVRAAELHTSSLWPEVETAPLGEWLLRSDPSPTGRLVKRANSCLAIDGPALRSAESLDQSLGGVRDFYAARDRPALIHTEVASSTETALLERGWSPLEGGDSFFMIASVARALRAVRRLQSPGTPATPGTPGDERTYDGALAESGTTVSVRAQDVRGSAALDGDWLGLHRLHVEVERRRLGLGTAAIARLLEWGAQRGATTAWLHVEVDNTAARALYERLHFSVHHQMTYLRPPPARSRS